MVAPPWFELPPLGYGGTEAIVASLVDSLEERGHAVSLVGAGRRRTTASRFVCTYPDPPSALLGTPLPEVYQAAAAASALDDRVDVVHDHTLAGPLLARGRRVPTVVTMHGPVGGPLGEYYRMLGSTVGVVAISDAQRRANPTLNWVDTVPNAIDVASFPFRRAKDDYLLWLGRFCPDKAPHLAVDAARRAGIRVVLAGKLSEPPEQAYFDQFVRPRLGPGVEYVGEADAIRKRELLAGARALLFPIQWEEPFGMVMIEAAACGTPVIAFDRGSVPEVVLHGSTGFIVHTMDEFVEAIDRTGRIDPAACRNRAQLKYDVAAMAAGYERVYRAVIADGPAPYDRRPTDALASAA